MGAGSEQPKVIYADVSLKGLTLEIATKRKMEALPTVAKLLGGLALHLPSGEQATVQVELDELAVDKPIFKQARAAYCGHGKYKIEIGVGLITQLAIVARGIAADKSQLRGRTRSKLLRSDVRKDGREKALSDFAFHYMLAFVMWHEVAHVALGHLDWLHEKTGLGIVNEFGFEPMPDNEFTRLQTLEGDADRQASMWTAAMIDYAAGSNPYLRYSSLADLFYDVGYIYGALFGFLDAIDLRLPANKRRHPTADVRLGIALAFIEDYLRKFHPKTAGPLQQIVISGGIDALFRMQHIEKRTFDPFSIFSFMYGNGERIDKMGIRRLQHKVSSSSDSSFVILGL